jgi:peptide deformylase
MKDILDEKEKILKTKSKDVEFPLSEEDKKTINDIIEFLTNSQIPELAEKYQLRPGMGLAAIQLGIPKRYFVVVHEVEHGVFEDRGFVHVEEEGDQERTYGHIDHVIEQFRVIECEGEGFVHISDDHAEYRVHRDSERECLQGDQTRFLVGESRYLAQCEVCAYESHQTEDYTEDDLLYDPGESRIEEHSADRRQYDSDHHQYDEHRGDVDELVVMPHRDDDEQCDTCGDRDVQDVLENDTDDGHQYGDAQCHPVQFHGRTVHLLCIEWILLVCTLGYIFVGHRHYNFVLE